MALDLFSETGRRKRVQNTSRLLNQPPDKRVQGDFGAYDSAPVQSIAPVDDAGQQSVPVTSFPNQINPDASVAFPVMEGFRDYVAQMMHNGADFLGVPLPHLTYDQTRDPETGDYVSRNLSADWSGVPAEVQTMAQLYLEPISGQMNRSIADENAVRKKTRLASPVQVYDRTSGQYSPLAGRSVRDIAPNQNLSIAPYFPLQSLFL